LILYNKLGKVLGHIRVIEFQKRGLPHAHILLILDASDKARTTSDYDTIVSAEIPDENALPLAYSTVTSHMMHGPCGNLKPNATCMKDGVCSKKFPRSFAEATHTEHSGYPVYQRRMNGRTVRKSGVDLDNRWIVPHNVYLCTKYDAHIHVEVCSTITVVKYLYKYVYKGHDQARISVGNGNDGNDTTQPPVQVNEINMFLDARYTFYIWEEIRHLY